MRKSELRRMEAKLRALETELDDAQMDEITDRAHEEYLRRCVVRDTRRNSRWKRYCRRVMVVAAATIALMVCSFAYTVMTPVTVSTANNAVRRAAIWVNDALQLGVEFPMPVDDGSRTKKLDSMVYNSLESAYEVLGINFLKIEELRGLHFDKLEVIEMGEEMYEFQIQYSNLDEILYITMSTLSDENTIDVVTQDSIIVSSLIGDVTIWKSGDDLRALTVLDGYLIQIQSNLSMDDFIELCKSISSFSLQISS